MFTSCKKMQYKLKQVSCDCSGANHLKGKASIFYMPPPSTVKITKGHIMSVAVVIKEHYLMTLPFTNPEKQELSFCFQKHDLHQIISPSRPN